MVKSTVHSSLTIICSQLLETIDKEAERLQTISDVTSALTFFQYWFPGCKLSLTERLPAFELGAWKPISMERLSFGSKV